MGCAYRDDCSSRGSRGRCGRGCRRAWWPSARRDDARRPCRTRSRPGTTCHASGGRGDPAAGSPKVSQRRGQHTQVMRFEASAAPQARLEAGGRASGVVHPYPRAVLNVRSTAAPPACHAAGSRITCREMRTGIRKVQGVHAWAGDGRRGFDRHCADRLLTPDEEIAKKSGAERRKKVALAQLLVDQICGVVDYLHGVPAKAWQILGPQYGFFACYVMVCYGCAHAQEREGLGKAVRCASPQDSQGRCSHSWWPVG